ncbi:MAG: TRC40/GET3/ArsA family transport-energizing ATPase [Desulfarculaceae bacterium]
MRLILFAGKGGTGKTSLAAATGALCASRGQRTLVLSLDPAHSLSDAFDLEAGLLELEGQPVDVAPNLQIQEINVNAAIEEYWEDVHDYITLLFRTAGLSEVVADEIAILPGMEEICALLYINHYVKNDSYDALILDCAPTAESMRFVSMPTALEWYMKKIFRLERNIAKVARPLVKRVTDLPLPGDSYFASIEKMFKGLQGVEHILSDPKRTTVRLISNPEKMVLRETQRAFMYFCLYGLSVEAVFLNRIWPQGQDGPLAAWFKLQQQYLEMAREFFAPVPIFQVPLKEHEILGYESLLELGNEVYGPDDPLAVLYPQAPLAFDMKNGRRRLKLHLPFVQKNELELAKSGDELIVQAGVFRKHIVLPHSFASAEPQKATFEKDHLVIEFSKGGSESHESQEKNR